MERARIEAAGEWRIGEPSQGGLPVSGRKAATKVPSICSVSGQPPRASRRRLTSPLHENKTKKNRPVIVRRREAITGDRQREERKVAQRPL